MDVLFLKKINERKYDDIRGLTQIFYYADHNAIEMVISKTTFNEIQATSNKAKRGKLLNYCSELWNYFHILIENDFTNPGLEVKYYEEFLSDKGLSHLSDINDRRLIIEALFYKCDVFCTRDYKTILRHRLSLQKHIPLEILTPVEWCLRYKYKRAY